MGPGILLGLLPALPAGCPELWLLLAMLTQRSHRRPWPGPVGCPNTGHRVAGPVLVSGQEDQTLFLPSRSSQSSTSHPLLDWSSLRTGIVILTSVSPDPQARLRDPVRTTQPPSPCSAHGSADVAGGWRCEGGVAPQSIPGEGLGLSAGILHTHTHTH